MAWHIMEYEDNLKDLITGLVPINQEEMLAFQEKKRESTLELGHLRRLEKSIWKQESRVFWFNEGNQNTSHFHRMTSNRRRVNAISPAIVGLNEDTTSTDIKRRVTSAFGDWFRSAKWIHVESWDVPFPSLDRLDTNS